MKLLSIICGIASFIIPLHSGLNNTHTEWIESLTLYASFDSQLKADFSKGDSDLYQYNNSSERDSGGLLAKPSDSIFVEPEAGRFGGALRRTEENPARLFFKAKDIIDYSPNQPLSGTISIWMRTEPDEDLPNRYCDPVMIMGRDFHQGSLFLEWSVVDSPRKFRYAILPRSDIWNPKGIGWEKHPEQARPMVQLSHFPFSRDKWTHVAFTFDQINAKEGGAGALYVNGKIEGVIDGYDFTLGWESEHIMLLLGVFYVGYLDELAVFNQSFSPEKIQELYQLQKGIKPLVNLLDNK